MKYIVLSVLVFIAGCQSGPSRPDHHVAAVDLERFMGDWFVIAHIPLPPEKTAWNAVESYRLDDKGRVQVTFRFRKGEADGPLKEYTPVAYITDHPSNAIWDMQFLWPFKADFRVVWLDDDYQVTVIGRQKRDYVWIMAREPQIGADHYQRIVSYLADQGYDIQALREVPHQWQGTPGY